MITVNVNNNPQHISKDTNLEQLVEMLAINTKGAAIAVNNQVISRPLWKVHALKPNDNILIVKATQGG